MTDVYHYVQVQGDLPICGEMPKPCYFVAPNKGGVTCRYCLEVMDRRKLLNAPSRSRLKRLRRSARGKRFL